MNLPSSPRTTDKHERQRPQPHSGETHCLSDVALYRSLINDIPLMVLSSLVALGMAGGSYLLGDSAVLGSAYRSALMLGMLLCGGVTCVVLLFRKFNVRYVIADDGVKAVRGILSNRQIESKLEYYQIRGTEIHRTLFERLIGTGDLHVRGATGSDTEVAFKGIYDPTHYQNLIQERHRLKVEEAKLEALDVPEEIRMTS